MMLISKRLIFSLMIACGGFLCLPDRDSMASPPQKGIEVTKGLTANGSNVISVSAPGAFKIVFGDGIKRQAPDETNVYQFFDLKNDPAEKFSLTGWYGGLLPPVYGYGDPSYEVIAGPGKVEILEQNPVRAVIKYSWNSTQYGHGDKPVDGKTRGEIVYVIYAPDKVFETFTLYNISNADLQMNYLQMMMWAGIRDLGGYSYVWNTAHHKPQPWTAYPLGTDPSARNAFLHVAKPDPPYIHGDAAGTTNIVKSNFLYVLHKAMGWYVRIGQTYVGLRSAIQLIPKTPLIPKGGSLTWQAAMFGGDNGITSPTIAAPYVESYRNPSIPSVSNGSLVGGGFDPGLGSYQFVSGNRGIDFTLSGFQHFPVFEVTQWIGGVPKTIKINNESVNLEKDYIGDVAKGKLLIQVLRNFQGSTKFQIISDASTENNRFFSVVARAVPASSVATLGRTIDVIAGDDLQAKLNAAKPGDVFLLQAGATWKRIIIPNIAGASATNPITVRTATPDAQLPDAATRITPAASVLLPKFIDDDSGSPAMTFADGAHDWIFMGIEFTRNHPFLVPNYVPPALVALGTYNPTSVAQAPSRILFDRVYVHGTPGDETMRGFWINGTNINVVHSWVDEIHNSGKDSQAIFFHSGPGPSLIDDNHLEASAENIIFCGSLLPISGVQPENVTITRNHVTKSLTWMLNHPNFVMPKSGVRYVVKNLFEMKCGAHVLVDGNLFEYNWASHQSGPPIGILNWQNVRGSPGSANTIPQAWTHDITFSNNIIRHVAGGFVIRGRDSSTIPESARNVTHHITIRNNLIYDMDLVKWCGVPLKAGCNSGDIFLYAPGGVDTLTVEHNTVHFNPPLSTLNGYAGKVISGKIYLEDGPPSKNLIYRNNLLHHGAYGVSGPRGAGNGTLDAIKNVVFAKNVIVGINSSLGYKGSMYNHYPDNWWVDDWRDVGFENSKAEDFRLKAKSPYKNAGSDGKDIGANIEEIKAAIGWIP